MSGRLLPSSLSLGVVVLLLAVWQSLAHSGLIAPMLLQPLDDVFDTLQQGFTDGSLSDAVLGTVGRMLAGFAIAAPIGLGLGLLIGLSHGARRYGGATLEFLRPMPASAIIPVAIMALGLTKIMIVTVIVFGSLWPVLLVTVQGVASTEPRLFEVARTMELPRRRFIAAIVLPGALPDIVAGLRLALTVSLILAVVTEMLSAEQGLGTVILLAARSFRSADLFGGIVLLGLVGLATNSVMDLAQARLLRWQS